MIYLIHVLHASERDRERERSPQNNNQLYFNQGHCLTRSSHVTFTTPFEGPLLQAAKFLTSMYSLKPLILSIFLNIACAFDRACVFVSSLASADFYLLLPSVM